MINPYIFCIFYSRRSNAEKNAYNLNTHLFYFENKTLNSDCIK